MKVYLVIYWCGSCIDDYYENKLGIFSTIDRARKRKEDYIEEHKFDFTEIGEGITIYEFELDKYTDGEGYKLEVE